MSKEGTSASSRHADTSVIETVQSLVVAFVLAMTFRGFVTEGFVIPTGSMAPTLLGRHSLVRSEQTGFEFAVGLDQHPKVAPPRERLVDPMLGPDYRGSASSGVVGLDRMGDRILVLKCLYPFWEPKRFDVVVFKNPTDPAGDAANYIKRLIGVPNEQVWLADGDVFAKPAGGTQFIIQRKPEHVQRAVWRPVADSDFLPADTSKLNRRWDGPPWVGPDWKLASREYECTTGSPTQLEWSTTARSITDWTAYNMFGFAQPAVAMSDIRVAATIVPQQAGLKTTLELRARGHVFEFSLAGGRASVSLKGEQNPETADAPIGEFQPGRPVNVEFWHVDQSMQIFIDGRKVVGLEYDWSPMLRLQWATDNAGVDDPTALVSATPKPAEITWRFEGSPLTMHRVRLDRDLFYRHDELRSSPQGPKTNPPYLSGQAFGTHPTENAANLGPDQFMMCGDNSQSSLDSRLWGSPHPLVAAQIDDHPFTVHRKLLLGKAWLVYFPAPYSLTQDGVAVVPDFGRLRFIR